MTQVNPALGLIALVPLVGSALSFCVGRYKKEASGVVATAASFLSFFIVLKAFSSLPEEGVYYFKAFEWFSFNTLSVDFAFRFDHLTAVMCLVVTGVGSLIHLYSIGYMAGDGSRPRFFAYLNLFMFSMLVLVLGANLLILFIGWEGVGLCSYLLIGFWYKNLSFAGAGRKAFVVNRIGDAGFLVAMFLCICAFGTLDFAAIAEKIAMAGDLAFYTGMLTVIAGCLFIGATGKSAQIPLFVWLPDAMAGPTPVSALIHAATMVTAGVYLLARGHFIFLNAPETMAVVAVIAVLTAFVAATTALAQNDIKKVLAYSTVSQLGFMFMAASAGAFWVAIFHLVTHAFFKACLFLCSGSVILGCHHEQDMRCMGGLRKFMPVTYWTYLISTLAIAGIAPFSGYYSKHAITSAFAAHPFLHGLPLEVLSAVVTVTAFLTAFYMTRSLVMTFHGEYRGGHTPHESPWTMTVPLGILALLAAVGGCLLGEPLFKYLESVIPAGEFHYHHEEIAASLIHSWLGVCGVLLGVICYGVWHQIPSLVERWFKPMAALFRGKYFFDEIYGFCVVGPLEGLAGILWKDIDQTVIDGAVNGTAALAAGSGELVRTVQSGQVRYYAAWMFGCGLLITALYLLW